LDRGRVPVDTAERLTEPAEVPIDGVFALAESQHGVVALFQASLLDTTRQVLLAHLRTSGCKRVHDQVFVRRGSVPSDAQRILSAVLSCGPSAWLAYSGAANWWGLPGFDDLATEVITTTRSRRPTLATRVRVRNGLDPRLLTVHDGVPICRPELVILQLCSSVHPDRAERALDNAWSMRLLSGRSLHAFIETYAASGRNGITVLRRLLEERGPGYEPPATNLEARAIGVLERAGLGRFRRQVNSGGEDWSGRVDLRHPDLPLIVEVQSERYHSSLLDQHADAERRKQLEVDGFVVVEITDDEVFRRPWQAVARVRAGLKSARTDRFC
jgi:very-short-patch-repair endonuclease